MNEVLHEALAMHNLPVTVLLGIILLYWLMVLVGAMDSDMDTVDIHADADAHFEAHVDGHSDVHSDNVLGGLFVRAGRFLRLGQVPLMLVMSILALFMWPISMLGNYYLNGTADHRSTGLALLLLIPNFIISALATRLVTTPIAAGLKKLSLEADANLPIVGRHGRVQSFQVDHTYGQIEIPTDGAPLLVNVRTLDGADPLPKGTHVVVLEATEGHHYLIRALRPDEQTNLTL